MNNATTINLPHREPGRIRQKSPLLKCAHCGLGQDDVVPHPKPTTKKINDPFAGWTVQCGHCPAQMTVYIDDVLHGAHGEEYANTDGNGTPIAREDASEIARDLAVIAWNRTAEDRGTLAPKRHAPELARERQGVQHANQTEKRQRKTRRDVLLRCAHCGNGQDNPGQYPHPIGADLNSPKAGWVAQCGACPARMAVYTSDVINGFHGEEYEDTGASATPASREEADASARELVIAAWNRTAEDR